MGKLTKSYVGGEPSEQMRRSCAQGVRERYSERCCQYAAKP